MPAPRSTKSQPETAASLSVAKWKTRENAAELGFLGSLELVDLSYWLRGLQVDRADAICGRALSGGAILHERVRSLSGTNAGLAAV